MRTLTIAVACLSLIACGESSPAKKSGSESSPLNPPKLIQDSVDSALTGSWVLDALPQSPTPFDKLYPRQRPMLFIQAGSKMLSGSTGCNRFSATLSTAGNRLNLTGLTSSTLVCPGDAETTFMKALKSSTQYSFRNNEELVLGADSLTWMVFRKK
jgi:heat shock protein HslJ